LQVETQKNLYEDATTKPNIHQVTFLLA